MYFSGHDYEVETTARGEDALAAARRRLPDLVLLDIGLPDMDGFAVCQQLRASPRTSHLPIIFLTERRAQSDRTQGLSAGAQDYITKPFDLEELRLRANNLIARSARENLVDPRTNLPTGPWIEEQLTRVRGRAGWSLLECHIESFQPFVDSNGFVAGDDVLKFSARLFRGIIDQLGTPEDFIGHPSNVMFVVITKAADSQALAQQLQTRFNVEVQAHYAFMDREQGFVLIRDKDGQLAQAPLMTLNVVRRAA
jgi:CheY-like chemotaxis protein